MGDARRGRSILLIEDSETQAVLLAETLRRSGMEVHRAASAEEGLACLVTNHPDLVVVDQHLPGMQGTEFCRAMRASTSSAIPILILTGETEAQIDKLGFDVGADDYVAKSSDSDVLLARIDVLLRRAARPAAAEARGDMAARLEAANRDLEAANRELREAHAQLVHIAKMASLGELVAGIAHEVNNPLAFSMGHLRTVARALDAIASDSGDRLSGAASAKLRKARTRTGDVADGLARVSELVTTLRTFSRLDEGAFRTVDIAECVDSALTFLQHRIGRGIEVTTDFAADNTLFCAPGLLNQVVLNLVSNAIDAVGEKGSVRIATRRKGGAFRISVGDSGPGVPEEMRQRIFEPFFTTKDVGRGTGMGLAICDRIVERHKGSIDVGPAPAGGAEFTVRIPLDLAEQCDAA